MSGKPMPATIASKRRFIHMAEQIRATLSRTHAILANTRRWGAPMRFLAATALVAGAALLRWALEGWVHEYNYFLFEFAVAVSAILLGRACGLWAMVLSAFVLPYWFVGPHYTFDLDGEDVVALLLFIGICLVLTMLGELMRGMVDETAAALEEKEILYREFHHRTRNNLQIINTTIALQRRSAHNREVRDNLAEVAQRIAAIARMDELLHRTGGSGTFDAREYFLSLAGDLRFSLAARRPITIVCDSDSCPITRNIADTLGIAMNELVTNALKYAFPDGTPGDLYIRFEEKPDEYVLTVQDNGKGCRQEQRPGTGWRIIESVLRRYDGTMTVEDAGPGCRVVVHLPRRSATAP
jgi:two-component sensor histidine kinase